MTHSIAEEGGGGDLILTVGQTLRYSRYTIIPLHRGNTLLRVRGWVDLILTVGQTLRYSRYTIIPLHRGNTLLRGRGWGGPNSDGKTETQVL